MAPNDTPSSDPNQQGHPGNEATVTTSVKLPEFNHKKPELWFRRAEAIFARRKITDPSLQANIILETIPEDVWENMAPWTEANPTATYTDIKDRLLATYGPTQEERATTIFKELDIPITDGRPSHVLYRYRALSRLPGTARKIDLVRQAIIHRLPKEVRNVLQDTDEMSDEEFGKIADKAARRVAQHQPVAAVSTTEREDERPEGYEDEEEYVAAPVTKTTSQGNRKNFFQPRQSKVNIPKQSFRQGQSNSFKQGQANNFICFYHKRFGPSAFKCENGCKYSKN